MAGDAGGVGGPLFLGVLQGLTEFLPVSSSGHLVLFQQFMDLGTDHVVFDLVLHLGTLVPVLWFYRRSVFEAVRDPFVGSGPWAERDGVRLLAMVALASIPTAAMGLVFEDLFEALFSRPAALVVTFAITGTLLFLTRRTGEGSVGLDDLAWWHAVLIGIGQGFAITPGISRSGTTIAIALFLGLRREFAARFSFLMSVPAILGASVLQLRDVEAATLPAVQLAVGGVAAMASGYLALVVLVRLVRGGNLSHFAWYCWAASLVAGGIALVRFL